MKSVGEAMGIGRTFKEAMNKTLRSLENGWSGFHANGNYPYSRMSNEALLDDLRWGTPDRILKIWQALTSGISPEEISKITSIDVWFLKNLQQLVEFETHITEEFVQRRTLTPETLRSAKRLGFSDKHIALVDRESGKRNPQATQRKWNIAVF